MHVPLKSLHSSRSMKRRVTSPHISESEPTELAFSPDRTDSDTCHLSCATAPEEDETGALSSESECPITDPATGFDSPGFGSPDKRVQFTIGAIPNIPEDESEIEVVKEPSQEKPRRKR